jgi:XRE family aerobic/anaerobic benzoate catabolism transcriptional regulator
MDADPLPDAAETRADTLLRALGDRLRLQRARRGMTRRALAGKSGVSERYIAQMEGGHGNVSVLLLHAIADALGIAATELLADPPEAEAVDNLLARLPEEQRREARKLLIERFGEDRARPERIALIGLRGAGKSSLGRMLAAARGAPFFELDREIERESGIELRELFERDGQAGFRRMERQVLERLVRTQARAVIAAGGSIVADARTYAMLLAHCRTVWIRASPEEHMQRVVDQGDLRPMADNGQAMADLRAILASREALYARADLTLDTSGRSLAESFAELKALLG